MDGGESQAQDAVYDCWMFLKGNECRKRGETKVVEIWECGVRTLDQLTGSVGTERKGKFESHSGKRNC